MFEIEDRRAFWLGTGASALFLALVEFGVGFAWGFNAALTVIVASCVLAGVPAGIIVGLTNRERRSPFTEAGIASLLGTILSLFVWLGVLIVLGELSLSQALDLALYIFGLSAPLLLLVGPITYAVAGFLASSIVGGETQFGATGARGLK